MGFFRKRPRKTAAEVKYAFDEWLSRYMDDGGAPTCLYWESNRPENPIPVEDESSERQKDDDFMISASHKDNGVIIYGNKFCYRQGRAVVLPKKSPPYVPLYMDFKYIGDAATEPLATSKYNVYTFANAKCRSRDEVLRLIASNYENHLVQVFTYYKSFPAHIKEIIKNAPGVYSSYLGSIITAFNYKYTNLKDYINYYEGNFILSNLRFFDEFQTRDIELWYSRSSQVPDVRKKDLIVNLIMGPSLPPR